MVVIPRRTAPGYGIGFNTRTLCDQSHRYVISCLVYHNILRPYDCIAYDDLGGFDPILLILHDCLDQLERVVLFLSVAHYYLLRVPEYECDRVPR